MMERALKERIIGAAILVLFVVLVVPIFLDGPPDATEMVSEPVLLPGQDHEKTQTVILDRNRTDPVPPASNLTQDADEPETEPAPVMAKKAEEPPPPVVEKKSEPTPELALPEPERKVQTPTPTASTTGMWAVQLGSFSNKENAEKLAANLRKQGYAAFLSQLATDSGQLHRVRIGPQKDRQSAEAMAARLLKVGHKGQVVPHP
jgi:DedD protein